MVDKVPERIFPMSNIHLSEPIIICGHNIRNRIVVPPMANFALRKGNNLVKPEHLQYYTAYAVGGAGLIIVEACSVVEAPDILSIYDDSCIPGMSSLAEAISTSGAVPLVQLLDEGIFGSGRIAIEQLSKEELLSRKNLFLKAAVRCMKAGFAGIELHAAHGFFLNRILENNWRTDEYGGVFENRVRLLKELIAEIKEACGENFIVSVRFGNPNYNELVNTAMIVEQAGGDLLDVSTGCSEYGEIPKDFEFDSKIYAASLVKKVAHIPVICVGNITTGQQAETILERSYADMTAIGRGHLCDSDWGNKAIAGIMPILCKNCRTCMWYIDNKKCPVNKRK
ncbi:MAG: NADH:flavin oxidoreductase [Lachnoclostridium edouardi]|uniref:NADH:flavin oxidoreductase n=1 Tax=Lachnoclostridium edouardi TaxID=1926283 RepID=UPI0026DBC3DC|nr:NADH:flavin oxidoreductase [Lachnoclostridium edouardi]MDO4279649.1 NADH:flavin oxidoreductase [Lachnoclostridium edouardi]